MYVLDCSDSELLALVILSKYIPLFNLVLMWQYAEKFSNSKVIHHNPGYHLIYP
jgi:hypothetical protein